MSKIVSIFICILVFFAQAQESDWRSHYGYILNKYVKESGFDYVTLKQSQADTHRLISVTKVFEVYTHEYIQQFSKDDTVAFQQGIGDIFNINPVAIRMQDIISLIGLHWRF